MEMIIDYRMADKSGIGVYITNIVSHLNSANLFSIKYICNDYQIAGLAKEGYKTDSLIIFKSRPFSILEQIEYFFKLPHADVLWIPHINIPFNKFRYKKLLVTVHDVFQLSNKHLYNCFAIIYFKTLFKFIKILADKIITVSEFSKKEIVRFTGIDQQNIEVIYNGLKPLSTNPNKNGKLPGRYILSVGNVKPHKNINGLIAAFNQISDKHQDLYLVIVGQKDGFYLNQNHLVKVSDDKVVFTGKVNDQSLENYYKNCEIFVFPSKYEGFGLPILEAMFYNKKILSSHIPPAVEIAGDSISYFDLEVKGDLDNKLDELLSSCVSLRPNFYAGILKKFTWERSLGDHIRVLKTI